MAHEITATDHLFAVGETPWHKLGTVLPADTKLTERDAIVAAHLDWTVSTVPLQTAPIDGTDPQAVPMGRAIRRDDTGTILACVGPIYEPLQNTDAFGAFAPWREAGLLDYETAGSLAGGRIVWILARLLVGTVDLGDNDKIIPYVLLSNAHDGTRAGVAKATGTRVVCANTNAMALRDGLASISVRHTGDVAGKAAAAVAGVDTLRAEVERRGDLWRAQTKAGADLKTLVRYLAAVYQRPIDEIAGIGTDAAGRARKPARVLEPTAEIFAAGGIGDLPTARGTVWGLYQALTQHLTHGGEGSRRSAESRLESNAFGSGAGVISRAEAVADLLASVGLGRAGLTWEDLQDTPTTTLHKIVAAKAA